MPIKLIISTLFLIVLTVGCVAMFIQDINDNTNNSPGMALGSLWGIVLVGTSIMWFIHLNDKKKDQVKSEPRVEQAETLDVKPEIKQINDTLFLVIDPNGNCVLKTLK